MLWGRGNGGHEGMGGGRRWEGMGSGEGGSGTSGGHGDALGKPLEVGRGAVGHHGETIGKQLAWGDEDNGTPWGHHGDTIGKAEELGRGAMGHQGDMGTPRGHQEDMGTPWGPLGSHWHVCMGTWGQRGGGGQRDPKSPRVICAPSVTASFNVPLSFLCL